MEQFSEKGLLSVSHDLVSLKTVSEKILPTTSCL